MVFESLSSDLKLSCCAKDQHTLSSFLVKDYLRMILADGYASQV
jgi:hypothetical protein